MFWSLAIEEQFYLLWPFVVWCLSRRTLIFVCLSLIVAAFALRMGMSLAGARPVAIYVLPFTRMDGLAAGGLLALLARSPAGLHSWFPLARRVAVASLLALIVLMIATGGLPIWGAWTQRLGYTFFVVFFSSLVALALNPHPHALVRNLFDRPLFRLFGRYSYAIYIGHLPVRMALRAIGFDLHRFPTLAGSALPGQLLFTATVIILSLLLAMASWRLIEKHAIKLKRLFPYNSDASKASDVTPSHGAVVAAVR